MASPPLGASPALRSGKIPLDSEAGPMAGRRPSAPWWSCTRITLPTPSIAIPSGEAFGKWIVPTSDSKARQSEEALLRHAGLPFDDPACFRQSRIALGDGSDPLRFMNSIVLDQNGLDAPDAERTVLVMVNGLGAALGVFYQNLVPLSKDIPNSRVYALDWLGMGRSGRPAFPADPETSVPMDGIRFFLDAFEDWRAQQGLDRFVLVGHSLGGYLSALYALWNPQRVTRLILVSPAGLPPYHSNPEVEEAVGGVVAVNGQLVPGWIRWLWARNITPQCFVRWFGPLGPSCVRQYVSRRLPTLPAADVLLFSEYMYHMTADVGSGEYALGTLMRPGAWAKEPLHDRLQELEMPVAFIYGSDDWMDYRHAQEAAAQIKVPVKIIRVPNSGHQLYLENPVAFNSVVRAESLDDPSLMGASEIVFCKD